MSDDSGFISSGKSSEPSSPDSARPPNAAGEETHKNKLEESVDDQDEMHLPVYRVRARFFLVPIITSILAAGVLAFITYVEANIQISVTIFSEQQFGPAGGAFLTALLYTLIAAVSSILIYLLVKRRGINTLRIIMTVTFVFLGAVLIFFFGLDILIIFSLPDVSQYILLVVGGVLGLFMAYVFYAPRFSTGARNVVVLVFGVLIGAFMGIIFPTWTTLAVLLGISLWDIISVKRGPIKKIFEIMDPEYATDASEEAPQSESIPKRDFGQLAMEIGIGDIAFYAMLASHSLISTAGNLLVWGLTILGILIGAALTLQLIRKNKILPGLPLSIFLGIGLFLVGAALTGILQNGLLLN